MRRNAGFSDHCSAIWTRRSGPLVTAATTRPRMRPVPVGWGWAAVSRRGWPGKGAPATPPGTDGAWPAGNATCALTLANTATTPRVNTSIEILRIRVLSSVEDRRRSSRLPSIGTQRAGVERGRKSFVDVVRPAPGGHAAAERPHRREHHVFTGHEAERAELAPVVGRRKRRLIAGRGQAPLTVGSILIALNLDLDAGHRFAELVGDAHGDDAATRQHEVDTIERLAIRQRDWCSGFVWPPLAILQRHVAGFVGRDREPAGRQIAELEPPLCVGGRHAAILLPGLRRIDTRKTDLRAPEPVRCLGGEDAAAHHGRAGQRGCRSITRWSAGARGARR